MQTANIKLEDLTPHQRDQLLSQLLAEQTAHVQTAHVQTATPITAEGRKLQAALIDLITNDVCDGVIHEVTSDIVYGFDNEIEDTIYELLSEPKLALQEAIEKKVIGTFLEILEFYNFCLSDINVKDEDDKYMDAEFIAQMGSLIGDQSENKAFEALLDSLMGQLPSIIERSVHCKVDVSEIFRTIKNHMFDYISASVEPTIAKNIHAAEVRMKADPQFSERFTVGYGCGDSAYE